MNAKNVLKKVLPPILVDTLRSIHLGKFYGLSGRCSSWDEAQRCLQKEYGDGYAEGSILQQVLAALREVR